MGRWIQIKDANWRIPYVGGWCEGYVEGAWGRATLPTITNQTTSGVHASATSAWNAEPNKHYDLPPAGITVPVFFSLGSTNLGHVAIRLDDLMVASSTQAGFRPKGYLHPNIQDLINLYAKYNNGCTYLGWGEHVGGMRVVKYQPDLTSQDVTDTSSIDFPLETVQDNTVADGITSISQVGVLGQRTVITKISYSDGVETSRAVVSDTTIPPVAQVTVVGTYIPPEPQEPTDPPVIPDLPPPAKPSDQPFFVTFLIWLLGLIKKIRSKQE